MGMAMMTLQSAQAGAQRLHSCTRCVDLVASQNGAQTKLFHNVGAVTTPRFLFSFVHLVLFVVKVFCGLQRL